MKKEFNLKIYAAVVFFVIAGLLATITVATYKSRYNGFSPEKTATAFVQSIVETGEVFSLLGKFPRLIGYVIQDERIYRESLFL